LERQSIVARTAPYSPFDDANPAGSDPAGFIQLRVKLFRLQTLLTLVDRLLRDFGATRSTGSKQRF
jgi:hypothetical protein